MNDYLLQVNEKWELHDGKRSQGDRTDDGAGCTALIVDGRYVRASLREEAVEFRLGVSYGDNVSTARRSRVVRILRRLSRPDKFCFGLHLFATRGKRIALLERWLDRYPAGDCVTVEDAKRRAIEILRSIEDPKLALHLFNRGLEGSALILQFSSNPLNLANYEFVHDSELVPPKRTPAAKPPSKVEIAFSDGETDDIMPSGRPMDDFLRRVNEKWAIHDLEEFGEEPRDGAVGCIAFVVDERYIEADFEPEEQLRIGVSFGDNVFSDAFGQGALSPPPAPGKFRFGLHMVGTRGKTIRLYDQWADDRLAGDCTTAEEAVRRAREILSSISHEEYARFLESKPNDGLIVLKRSAPVDLSDFRCAHDTEP